MGKGNFKPHQTKSIIKRTLEEKKRIATEHTKGYLVFSLRHLDRSQGNSLFDWEGEGRLAHAMDVLSGYCNRSLLEQVDGKKFTIYGNFPPKESTDYIYPPYIPEDANWARIHINGVQIVVGHVFENTFYIVFLDGEHKFWKSTKGN